MGAQNSDNSISGFKSMFNPIREVVSFNSLNKETNSKKKLPHALMNAVIKTSYGEPFIVLGEMGINTFYAIGTIEISKSFDGYIIYHNYYENSMNTDKQIYLAVFSKNNLLIDFIRIGQLIEGLEEYNNNIFIYPDGLIVRISYLDNKTLYEKYFFQQLNDRELQYYTIKLNPNELKDLNYK